jgi:hypothetical protein
MTNAVKLDLAGRLAQTQAIMSRPPGADVVKMAQAGRETQARAVTLRLAGPDVAQDSTRNNVLSAGLTPQTEAFMSRPAPAYVSAGSKT